jgi:hypothetical protein
MATFRTIELIETAPSRCGGTWTAGKSRRPFIFGGNYSQVGQVGFRHSAGRPSSVQYRSSVDSVTTTDVVSGPVAALC